MLSNPKMLRVVLSRLVIDVQEKRAQKSCTKYLASKKKKKKIVK